MAWSTVTVEGGLFPSDLLDQIAEGEGDGQQPQDFGLERGRLSDEIQSAFSDAQSYWDSYRRRIDRSAEDQHTGLTRNAWMLPFFGLLGYREGDIVFRRESTTVGGVDYAISHFAGTEDHAPPIHILGCQYELHRRPPQGGRSPHALVQEFLNRDEALWGIVTNGLKLRVLRDSQRMARPTYIEFDLEGMITGSQYAEFALLYRMLHRSRFPRGAADAHTCLLERWFEQGIEQGGRVRDRLRDGVEAALEGLGRGFLQHRDSATLREQISSGRYTPNDYYRELLKLIYRLLFLMVAEERRLLFTVESSDKQRIYDRYYSATQLRERAALPGRRTRESERHSDLWQGLLTTFRLFRSDDLAEQLGLYALNGELFGEAACRRLEGARISNADLLEAIDRLARFDDGQLLRPVNYAALDVEELGSVYESLLDFEPVIDSASLDQLEMWGFRLTAGGGRKSSGSYYTPRELVQELIGSALVPVIEQRLKDAGRDPEVQEEALLSMTVIDPAAGSGHFLLAAARRIARELARVRTGEREPAPEAVRTAMRDVVPSCIYGVDKNEMAVDLCKVGLWIEGHAPGRPLSFLDHHIKHGDSLIGVYDLDVLKDGIPDGAYKALTGDDKAVAARMKKVNKQNRAGQLPMLAESIFSHDARALGFDFSDLRSLPDSTPRDVEEKAQIYESLRSQDTKWWDLKVACDLWTYAFFAPLTQESWIPTSYDVRQAAQKSGANAKLEGDAIAASTEHPYFHWPLEFPDVFDEGGFDVVVGNPPWERYALQEKEWFAGKDDNIANAPNAAARKRMIAALETGNPPLFADFQAAKHLAEAQSDFTREGGRYPLGAKGQINQYQVFAELGRSLLSQSGMFGVILPTGLATDNNTKELFGDIVARSQLVNLFDFENKFIFPAIHKSYKFSLVTLCGSPRKEAAEFSFFLHQVTDLGDRDRRFYLSAEDIERFNPRTKTLPIFRTRRDAEINIGIYAASGTFEADVTGGYWDTRFNTLFHMAGDSNLFHRFELGKSISARESST
ncbi:MAG: N-6 DNA methylase [Chloroflexi bacterium]|nr:N-6 DNA methylase [Chloroflexota bacterium]